MINTSKTKVTVIDKQIQNININFEGNTIEQVQNFSLSEPNNYSRCLM